MFSSFFYFPGNKKNRKHIFGFDFLAGKRTMRTNLHIILFCFMPLAVVRVVAMSGELKLEFLTVSQMEFIFRNKNSNRISMISLQLFGVE